tara:strand:+ start:308 stop:718 length:411 start_codon:yes stop_codon:yes gene_type:complete
MKRKVVRLNEKDIESLVKKIVNESSDYGIQNYMFFQNLKEIRDNIDTLLSMDQQEVDSTLSNSHGWALEHMATAKDDIEEVTSFLKHRDSGINEEESKKDDRCTRIAKRKYDTWPSAYASGAVVRCRKGEIWKDEK